MDIELIKNYEDKQLLYKNINNPTQREFELFSSNKIIVNVQYTCNDVGYVVMHILYYIK